MSDWVTPVELARRLGHLDGGRSIRAYLRARYPSHAKWARWELTDEQVADVVAQFSSNRPPAPGANNSFE